MAKYWPQLYKHFDNCAKEKLSLRQKTNKFSNQLFQFGQQEQWNIQPA